MKNIIFPLTFVLVNQNAVIFHYPHCEMRIAGKEVKMRCKIRKWGVSGNTSAAEGLVHQLPFFKNLVEGCRNARNYSAYNVAWNLRKICNLYNVHNVCISS